VSGSSWNIKYGDGSTASGIVGTDNVTLGGLCIENQAIELASKLSSQFAKSADDGLLGLAFGKINTVKPKGVATPIENMVRIDSFSPNLVLTHLSPDLPKRHSRRPRTFYVLPRLLA
jgi:hypothetical protein